MSCRMVLNPLCSQGWPRTWLACLNPWMLEITCVFYPTPSTQCWALASGCACPASALTTEPPSHWILILQYFQIAFQRCVSFYFQWLLRMFFVRFLINWSADTASLWTHFEKIQLSVSSPGQRWVPSVLWKQQSSSDRPAVRWKLSHMLLGPSEENACLSDRFSLHRSRCAFA